MKSLFYLLLLVFCSSCKTETETHTQGISIEDYHNYSQADKFAGGIKMIPIKTPKGVFNVWTKRVGDNPKIKVLLLHGGPGMTHEIYECFDGYFPREGIEYYYYDQLGSYYSDQPDDKSLWNNERFVDEVEQVRIALGLNKDNFYLYGQSWGGILAMEYALKHQDKLKGLVISNMVASIPEYQKYSDEVLAPKMDPDVLKEIMAMEDKEDYSNPRYLDLIVEHYYTEHVIRMPVDQWPEPINRAFKHLNPDVYVTRRFLLCPNGSHLSQFDDQENFFNGLIKFIKDVDSGTF